MGMLGGGSSNCPSCFSDMFFRLRLGDKMLVKVGGENAGVLSASVNSVSGAIATTMDATAEKTGLYTLAGREEVVIKNQKKAGAGTAVEKTILSRSSIFV